jgi:hypothetical protein
MRPTLAISTLLFVMTQLAHAIAYRRLGMRTDALASAAIAKHNLRFWSSCLCH